MIQTKGIINTLKSELKSRGITYSHLATHLDMSEANIKKMFSSNRFTLYRLESICHIMGLDILQLIKNFEQSRHVISYLSQEQEKILVNDIKLLLVAVCVQNGFSFQEIINSFTVSKTECIQHLVKLDRLQLIELQPNNKFRLLINEDFHWIPDGPIENFFEQQLQPEFLNSGFLKEDSFRTFKTILLSQSSQTILIRKIEKLCQDVSELHLQDSTLPIEERHSSAILIATRRWIFSAFKELSK